MEDAVDEALANNVLGTRNVVHAAEKFGIERFVLISTDKAVNPSNVMGATKRLAELIVRDTARRSGRAYVAVRFGNVLGSRGSVIPIFQRQIAQGGPVTVTHPDMRRFFMTIPEAAQLVLGAGGMAQGGEVYVLDMGESVRIVDLARDLLKMAGLQLERDIQIVYSGIRPGEKLDEELFYKQEDYRRTSCQRIFCADDDGILQLEEIERLALDLLERARQAKTETERKEMHDLLLSVSRQPGRYLLTPVSESPVWDKPGDTSVPVAEVVSLNRTTLAHIRGTPLSGAAA
jgi:FlaA1/EpsC-like NDP-sugar epimerase